MTRGGLERDQRSHGMTNERGLMHAGGIHQRDGPIRHGADRSEVLPGRVPVPGQVRHEHAVPAMGKPAREQREYRVVEAAAVQEDDEWLVAVELATTGRGIDLMAAQVDLHGSRLLQFVKRVPEIVDDVAGALDTDG